MNMNAALEVAVGNTIDPGTFAIAMEGITEDAAEATAETDAANIACRTSAAAQMSVPQVWRPTAGTVAAFLKRGGRVKARGMFQHDAGPDAPIVPEPIP